MLKSVTTLENPYPNKCYLPFFLYPPAMYPNTEGHGFIKNLRLDLPGEDFVLYIGIPFCRVRCKGCPYFVTRLSETDPRNEEDVFVDALIEDIRLYASFRKWKTGLLRAIYIGGGTGTILKTRNLTRIVDEIFKNFNVDKEYCLTLEGNARDYDEEKLDYITNSEITRVSLGVQSFQKEILKIVGSPHAADESIRVIKALQKRGFNNIQMDLMFNMPGHTLDVWQKDLDVLSSLDIPHFTIYLYRIHDHTPQHLAIQSGKIEAPRNAESPIVKAMYREALVLAEQQGYQMYMVDHFSKPGYENKYNYWSWKVYTDALAIGPGGYSYFDGYRLGTNKDVKSYIEHVNRGEFLISTITPYMNEQIEKERYIIFTLLYFCVEYQAYFSRFKSNFLEDFSGVVKKLLDKGLVCLTDGKMELTLLGREWHTNVILEFINDKYWGDKDALSQPNWSMNISMVQVCSYKKEHWLG